MGSSDDESITVTEIIGLLHYCVLIIAVLSLLVTLSNLRSLKSLDASTNRFDNQNRDGPVSVLIPARNEAENIAKCLHALIAQTYRQLEILVLNDRSTDRTAEVIQNIAKSDRRVRMISGAELPNGWIGKNWACHQLWQEATGESLLFIDADTILSEGVIQAAVTNSRSKNVDLLTMMPQRITNCVIEKLLFPFIAWASFCWMPMKRAHNSQNPHLSATFGQFMLFKREAYQAIGGHSAIRAIPIDDFELGRATKKRGLRWMLFNGANCVQVLPSKGNIDAFMCVSRSVFPAIYSRFSVLTLLSVVLLALGFLPLLTLGTSIMSYPEEKEALLIATTSICTTAIPWFIVCQKFNHSMLTALLYPVAIALMVIVGYHSMITYSLGITSWKRRKMTALRR